MPSPGTDTSTSTRAPGTARIAIREHEDDAGKRRWEWTYQARSGRLLARGATFYRSQRRAVTAMEEVLGGTFERRWTDPRSRYAQGYLRRIAADPAGFPAMSHVFVEIIPMG